MNLVLIISIVLIIILYLIVLVGTEIKCTQERNDVRNRLFGIMNYFNEVKHLIKSKGAKEYMERIVGYIEKNFEDLNNGKTTLNKDLHYLNVNSIARELAFLEKVHIDTLTTDKMLKARINNCTREINSLTEKMKLAKELLPYAKASEEYGEDAFRYLELTLPKHLKNFLAGENYFPLEIITHQVALQIYESRNRWREEYRGEVESLTSKLGTVKPLQKSTVKYQWTAMPMSFGVILVIGLLFYVCIQFDDTKEQPTTISEPATKTKVAISEDIREGARLELERRYKQRVADLNNAIIREENERAKSIRK